jgi:transposase
VPYLQQRWAEGCHCATDLFQEIQARGYRGSYPTCAQVVAALRPAAPTGGPCAAAKPALSARQVAGLFLARPEALSAAQQATLARLCQGSPRLAAAASLARSFAAMVRERQGGRLEAWIQEAAASGIAEWATFARGLREDQAAVQAGLTLAWSQGQTEGFVNKLKMLKRQMFGRAKLDLLRQRVLLA